MAEMHKLTKNGETIYPATTTDSVVHPELQTSLTSLINEYNVSVLYPTGGLENTDKYDLETAVTKLDSVLDSKQKTIGTKLAFISNDNGLEEYTYTSGSFNNISSWNKSGVNKFNELDKNTNYFVYTDNFAFNKVIKHLFVDTTNYDGSYSLEGLSLTLLNKNTNDDLHLYGFRIVNKNKETIGDFWNSFTTPPENIELTKNGVYVYAEFYWDGMEDKSVLHDIVSIKYIAFDSIGDTKRKDDKYKEQLNERLKTLESGVEILESDVEILESGVKQINSDISNIQLELKNTSINQLIGIGTVNPKYLFSNKEETDAGPKIDNINDTDSPFRDILGYATKITNTKSVNKTCFFSAGVDYINARPNNIKFSFFTKKEDWVEIDDGFLFGFSIFSYSPQILSTEIKFSIKEIISGETEIGSNNGSAFNCNYNVSKGYDDGKYCQILLNIDIIEWKLSEEAGLRPLIQLGYQQSKWTNKPFLMINQQLVFDNTIVKGISVCPDIENVIDFYYPRTLDSRLTEQEEQIKNLSDEIDKIKPFQSKKNILKYNADTDEISYINSSFNDTSDIQIEFICKRGYSLKNNPCFNFTDVYLIDKELKNKTRVHSTLDDITPSNFNNTYIGANHGCSNLRLVTCTNHGKTYNDIGSEWTNGKHKFYIIGIIDNNSLWVLGENYLEYPLWGFYTVEKGETLEHVSGATNTGSIAVENSVMNQFFPSLKVSSLKIIADGKEIVDSGEYEFDELNICEIYDIFNVASTLEKIKAKVGTFIANPTYNALGADKVVRHSINYKFTSADKCFVNTNFIAYQNISIGYFGFMQQAPLFGAIKMYIPKTLPIISAGEQKDFRLPIDYNSVTETINVTDEYWENPLLPPDRYIQSSEDIVFNGGYLFDHGVGGNNRKDVIDKAFYLYTSRKIYPHGIDSKINIKAGDVYNAVCYRIYSDINKFNKNGIINDNIFEYEGKLYMYLDFNKEGFYDIDIPEKYIGKTINTFEKSENVNLLTNTANSKVLIRVKNSTPMYGYIVMFVE